MVKCEGYKREYLDHLFSKCFIHREKQFSIMVKSEPSEARLFGSELLLYSLGELLNFSVP